MSVRPLALYGAISRGLARAAGVGALSLAVGAGLAASGCKKPQPVPSAGKMRPSAAARVARVPRPPPPPPRNADGTYTVKGLRYFEVVTGGANPNDSLPMIAAFHGHGGTPDMFVQHFAAFPARARVIAPYGFEQTSKGFEWFPVAPKSMRPQNNAAQVPGESYASDKIATALRALMKVRPTIGKPILTGFSMGAGMSYAIGLRHPDLVAWVCSMSGKLPSAIFAGVTAPKWRPEVHGFHGSVDHTAEADEDRRTITSFQKLGFKADIQILPGVGHDWGAARQMIDGCLSNGLHAISLVR